MGKGKLAWKGREIQRAMKRAAVHAVNESLEASVAEAKANHPGWKSRTGKLESSIGVRQEAKVRGSRVSGMFGAGGRGVWYGKIKEKQTEFLERAADKVLPEISDRLRRAFRNRAPKRPPGT